MNCPVCQTDQEVVASLTHEVWAHHCPAAGVPIYWNGGGVFSSHPGLRGGPRHGRVDRRDRRAGEQSLGRISGGEPEARQTRDQAAGEFVGYRPPRPHFQLIRGGVA